MRVLIWLVEETWRATVLAAAAVVPENADITLLHVIDIESSTLVRAAPHGLMGRHRDREDSSLESLSEQEARQLLTEAESLLGRQASLLTRRGHLRDEVLAAAQGVDLLVMARDRSRAHSGPHSLGHVARFVVDHAPCAVLLVWPDSNRGGRMRHEEGDGDE